MKTIGQLAETKAIHWLEKQGCHLITRNFFCPFGEIDAIMQHNHLLLFVEVRFRNSNAYGGALSSISPKKKQCIRQSSQLFLQQHPQWQLMLMRFDVLALNSHQIDWIQGAF